MPSLGLLKRRAVEIAIWSLLRDVSPDRLAELAEELARERRGSVEPES